MNSNLIFWPVMAQILIPIIVLMVNKARKKADIQAGNYDADKSPTDNEAWSLPVVLTSKNLANQSQVPLLFYVLCIVLAVIDGVTALSLGVACAFVLSRYIHCYVHITSNHVPHRLRAFVAGVILVVVLWALTAMALLKT